MKKDVKNPQKKTKQHRTHASYYEYVSNVVDKCGHKYLVLQTKSFRDYKVSLNSNPEQPVPGGIHYKITPQKCKSYSCPICGKKKVLDLVDKLKTVDFKKYRFFTLTLKNKKNYDDTEKNLLRVSKCFNRLNNNLRKKPEFKNLEYFRVTEIGNDGMVHIHGVWNKYVPVKLLSEMWEKITTDSYIVNVKRIQSKKDVTNYLFKYLTKDVAKNDMRIDPSFFNLDLKNSAALFYESGKRRYNSSRNFFPKVSVKKSDWLPYYFESSDVKTVENFIVASIRQFKLKKENFDFSNYYESEQFLYEIFKVPPL
jgi:hypothetical protein